MLRKWEAINLIEVATNSLEKNAAEVVELQRQQLYQSGVGGNDVELPNYSPATVASGYLQEKGNPRLNGGNGPFDLRGETGSFYDNMLLRLNGETMEIDSSDSKTEMLVAEYGPAILKLDTVSKNGLRKNIMQPDMVREIAAKTGCGFS